MRTGDSRLQLVVPRWGGGGSTSRGEARYTIYWWKLLCSEKVLDWRPFFVLHRRAQWRLAGCSLAFFFSDAVPVHVLADVAPASCCCSAAAPVLPFLVLFLSCLVLFGRGCFFLWFSMRRVLGGWRAARGSSRRGAMGWREEVLPRRECSML